MDMEKKPNSLRREIPKEIKDCLHGLNPGFQTKSPAYTDNCQRCVMAYEVRRRGYSTMAKPHLYHQIYPLFFSDFHTGWPAVFEKQMVRNCSARTPEQVEQRITFQMQIFGNHSRAIIKVNWLHSPKGHLFIAENVDDVVYFVDPQTGEDDVRWYFRQVDPARVALMRIDCVRFTELVQACCE